MNFSEYIVFIRKVVEKKWEYSGVVHELYIDFERAYDSVRKEVLYRIMFSVSLVCS